MAQQTTAAKDADASKGAHGIDPRRQAALDTALAQVEKSFGKGSAMRLGDKPPQEVEVIPTGAFTWWPMRSVRAVWPRSSTPSTPWTPCMPRSLAWIPIP